MQLEKGLFESEENREYHSNERDLNDVFENGSGIIQFRHQEIFQSSRLRRTIKRKAVLNALNYIHFTGRDIYVHVRQKFFKEYFLVKVQLESCASSEVFCRLPMQNEFKPENYDFLNLVIDQGKSVILIPAEFEISGYGGFVVRLPEFSFIHDIRKNRRYECQNIDAEIVQKDQHARGILKDFSPSGLRISLSNDSADNPDWLDKVIPVSVCIKKRKRVLFAGTCRFIRFDDTEEGRILILSPSNKAHSRYKERKYRNPRMNLVPTPKIEFMHPLCSKYVKFEIDDITTSGFSVFENADEALLIPGLAIPNLSILYAGNLKMKCSAQVIYRSRKRNGTVRCGFTILDMDLKSYSQLFDIVGNADDSHTNMISQIDMDTLWEFFFNSGFIYSKKYELISPYKDNFKETYRKLYHLGNDIFTCFTYQENGTIFGHSSMVRAYSKTWMAHHFAALPVKRRRSGIRGLNQMLNYFDGVYRLPSVGIDYLMFYYRPQTQFVDYFFGDACRELNNQKGCSIDLFAYHSIDLPVEAAPLPDGWTTELFSGKDATILETFYESISGGLLLDALPFKQSGHDRESLESAYRKIGLNRKSNIYSLKKDEKLMAVFVVDESDHGVNLSELLNSIKIIVTNPEGLPWNILYRAVGILGRIYNAEKIPILVYPSEYLDSQGIKFEKHYQLLIFAKTHGYDYIELVKKRAKIRYSKLLVKYIQSLFQK